MSPSRLLSHREARRDEEIVRSVLMTCQKVQEHFWEYSRRELSENVGRLIDAHLQSCKACAAEFDQFSRVEAALEGLPDIEPSPHFDQKLNAKLASIGRQTRSSGLWIPWWKDRYVWSFAVVLLATVALWIGFRHQQGRELTSMEAVIQMQDNYLGKKSLTPKNEVAVQERALEVGSPASEELEEEGIPEEDLAVVENFDLLQNYDFLKKFDLADQPDGHSSRARTN